VTGINTTEHLEPKAVAYKEIYDIKWVPISLLKKYHQTSQVYGDIINWIDNYKLYYL